MVTDRVRVRSTDMPGDEDTVLLQRLQTQVDDHIERFNEHVDETNERWDKIAASQESNTQSISQLVVATEQLHESTKDVTEAWETAVGVVKFGGMIGRFVKWLAGFAVLGAMFTGLSEVLKSL